MQRRDFLLTGCKACGLLLAAPALASLESCSTTKALSYEPAAGSSMLEVPITVFGERNSAVIRTSQVADQIWITRLPDGSHRALALKCTHKGGPLSLQGDAMQCAWHDSRFDLEGKPVGGPAKSGLKSYPVAVEGGVMKIDLG